MAHVNSEKVKLLNRLHRISGQLTAIERAVEEDNECARVLQQATACRGALDSFIFEVIEDHIREHVMTGNSESPGTLNQAGEELIGILKSYIK